MDLSIIIVSWNAKEFLWQCLRSIYNTTRGVTFEVWVIDNNSSDGSPEMVEKEFPQVNLVCTGANLGFAKANNIGIRKSSARYVCLINSDIKVLDGCIDLLCNYMDQHPKTGIVGPRTFHPDMTPQQSCAEFPSIWSSLTFALGLSKIFPKSKVFGHMYTKYWPFDTLQKVDMLRGCFLVVCKKAIEQVGLLDEDFFIYMEDFDWCKRFWKAGWDVVLYPDAQVIHYQGGSSEKEPIKNTVERHRSKILYWKKHHSRIGVWYIITLELIRQLLHLIQNSLLYLFKSSARNALLLKMKGSVASIRWLMIDRLLS